MFGFILLQHLFYCRFVFLCKNKINAATILQGYCSTHSFYFIAHETTSLVSLVERRSKVSKIMVLD